MKRKRDGELESTDGEPRGWSPDLEREFTFDEVAANTVTQTLDQLKQRELIERVRGEESSGSDQMYWRLTERGKREQERLEQHYRRGLGQLQLNFGMTTDW